MTKDEELLKLHEERGLRLRRKKIGKVTRASERVTFAWGLGSVFVLVSIIRKGDGQKEMVNFQGFLDISSLN